MKNLFLEGESGSGKSTLILSELGELVSRMSGYGVERLHRSSDGTIIGYRVVPAMALRTADVNCRADLSVEDARTMEGMFICSVEPRWKNTEVFTRCATEYLKTPSDTPAVLMDEFGGIELLDERFTQELKKVIAEEKPVVGVLKSRRNAERAAHNLGLPQVYHDAYEELREYIENRSDSVILNLDITGKTEIIKALREWKNGVY